MSNLTEDHNGIEATESTALMTAVKVNWNTCSMLGLIDHDGKSVLITSHEFKMIIGFVYKHLPKYVELCCGEE